MISDDEGAADHGAQDVASDSCQFEKVSPASEGVSQRDDKNPGESVRSKVGRSSRVVASLQASAVAFNEKENFMANLQLFKCYKKRRPLKKEIKDVLKTRNIIKA